MRRHIILIMALIFLTQIFSLNPVCAAEIPSIRETTVQATNLIGDAIIFMSDCDAVFYGGKKYSCSELSTAMPYVTQDGALMVPCDAFDKAFGTVTTASDSGVSVNQTQVPAGFYCKKDGKTYLSVEYAAVSILGKSLYKDRGMFIFSASEFQYKNSDALELIFERIDTIYRYMRFERNSAGSIYARISSNMGGNVHPRLLTNSAELVKIKAGIQNDAFAAKAYKNTIAQADALAADNNIQEYNIPDGTRLLVAARNVMEKCVTLSAAYLLTGNEKYPERIWKEFIGTEQVPGCFNWQDWNTAKHYLDNSELLYGVAVAFDSCYDYWKKTGKTDLILEKTYEYSMQYSVKAYKGETFTTGAKFMKTAGNWGFVCNGAIISACIAFGLEGKEEYQPYYDYLLENAMQGIEYPLMLYYPDGAWCEGQQYWEYATRYFAGSVLAPLYFSCGTAFGLDTLPGVSNTAESVLYMQNKKYAYNFDNNGFETRVFSEAAFVIPMITGDGAQMTLCARECNDIIDDISARTVMWYRPQGQQSAKALALDGYFQSSQAGSMRENWTSPKASCVFFKGGNNGVNAHFDAGSFCFDALGERWAADLGKGQYNIEGGYSGVAGLDLYVRRPEGHNCVVINPREDVANQYYGGQAMGGYASLRASGSSNKAAYAVVDLSDVYKYDTAAYKRGYYLGNNRHTLTVQDEIEFDQDNSQFYWFMHTTADIQLDEDKKGALLTIGSRKVHVDALSDNIDFEFRTDIIEQRFETDPVRAEQWEPRFASYNVLTAAGTGSGNAVFAVRLTPIDDDYLNNDEFKISAIDTWTLPQGEFVGFVQDNGIIPLEKGDALALDARLTGNFESAQLFAGDTLLSANPIALENGNYRFSFTMPQDIYPGKMQLLLKAVYNDGAVCTDKTDALIYTYNNEIDSTVTFENQSLAEGAGIAATTDVVPSLSDISTTNGSFSYSCGEVGGNSSGKIRYTTLQPKKYGAMSYTDKSVKTGMELRFKWYAQDEGAWLGVQTRPNCYAFEENSNVSNIPIFKDRKIFMTDTQLQTGHWYDIAVRAVKTGNDSAGMPAYTYTVIVDGVLYKTSKMPHIEGKSQNILGLGLLIAGSNAGDVSYVDDISTKYFTADEASVQSRSIQTDSDGKNIIADISKYNSNVSVCLSGEYCPKEKAVFITAAYRNGVLYDVDLNDANPNERVNLCLNVRAQTGDKIAVMMWTAEQMEPITSMLDVE